MAHPAIRKGPPVFLNGRLLRACEYDLTESGDAPLYIQFEDRIRDRDVLIIAYPSERFEYELTRTPRNEPIPLREP